MDVCLDESLKLDYLNGALSGRDRARFEEHLAACPGCRREIEGLRNAVTAVAGLPRPSVPPSWAAAAKDRLRSERSVSAPPVQASPIFASRRTNVFQYGVISAGVTAAVVLLLRLVVGGAVQRWLPGLSTAGLGISDPGVARTANFVTVVISLHSLLFVPSIIDNLYLLLRRHGRKNSRGASAGFFAC
jgi:anti-sigma factor RsiW